MSYADGSAQSGNRSLSQGFKRGLAGRCPNCGEGRLFRGYLAVEPRCSHCDYDLSRYRADDGPAYFTILIVGHFIIAPMLCFSFIWTWNPILVMALTLPFIVGVTLALLPRIKGAFIGCQWSNIATPYA
jgi:uncharacterized protein (DUF983 family)